MKKIKKLIFLIIFVVSLVALVYSSIKIINWYKNNKKNIKIEEKINKYITVDNKSDEYKIDFDKIKKQNKDAVAYLKVNNTSVDYVVVQGKDNEYYLHHNFNKEYNVAGWIFADYRNKLDGTDKNVVVYGHNMLYGTMFGGLKKVLNKKWYSDEKNLEITFITEKEDVKYKVFSVYTIEPEEYYITTSFGTTKEFKEFINVIKSRSINKFDEKVDVDDSILTLSTCSDNGKERIVLHAFKIKNKDE